MAKCDVSADENGSSDEGKCEDEQVDQVPEQPVSNYNAELDGMLSQFVSPISDKIYMDYDPKLR